VTLEVFNVRGEILATIFKNQKMDAGQHQAVFSAESLASGIYFYRLQAGDLQEIRKMTLLQ